MTLSVIIPVYRVEDTLDRCISSIVNQSYADWEIILVDDGSPDSCPQKCDDWARKDARIHVIHQKNGGLSDARNAGIEVAQGEFITFVDSDDYLEEDTLSSVMNVILDSSHQDAPLDDKNQDTELPRHNNNYNNCIDILEYPIYRFFGSKKQSLLTFEPEFYDDMQDYWLKGRAYEHAYACNKIFRRNLFDQVRFPKGKHFEDMHILPLLLEHARRVVTIPQGLYYYCWNADSITATADGTSLNDLLQANLQAKWMDDRSYLHVLNIQIDVYEQKGEVTLGKRKIDTSANLSHAEKVKGMLVNLLGVEGVCRLFRFLHHIKSPKP